MRRHFDRLRKQQRKKTFPVALAVVLTAHEQQNYAKEEWCLTERITLSFLINLQVVGEKVVDINYYLELCQIVKLVQL